MSSAACTTTYRCRACRGPRGLLLCTRHSRTMASTLVTIAWVESKRQGSTIHELRELAPQGYSGSHCRQGCKDARHGPRLRLNKTRKPMQDHELTCIFGEHRPCQHELQEVSTSFKFSGVGEMPHPSPFYVREGGPHCLNRITRRSVRHVLIPILQTWC